MLLAFAVDQLAIGQVALAADAVQSGVVPQLDGTRVVEALHEVLDGLAVILVGGANEPVVFQPEGVPGRLKTLRHLIGEALWLHALRGG